MSGTNTLGDAPGWGNAVETTLTADTLMSLFRNDIALICIDDFATAEECEAIAQKACLHGFDPYEGVEPKITRIGCTVFEYDTGARSRYFDDVQRTRVVQDRIFSESWNPVARLIQRLTDDTGIPADVARSESGQAYYAGLIRRIEGGTLLHIDYAPAEHQRWSICSVSAQLSWNLYLRLSDASSGHTDIYQRQWDPADMARREGSYGFDHSVVAGSRKVTLTPKVGRLALFNTKNYHEVASARGERVAVTSALGLTPSDELVLWS